MKIAYRLGAAVLLLLAGVGCSNALVLPEIAEMVPHRAVYEFRLGSATSAAGITDVRGRLVFEFNGSTCEGYSQKMRFVMSVTDREGTTKVNDLRSTTWEDAAGAAFRFEIENLEDRQRVDLTTGSATRDDAGQVAVALTKPVASALNLAEPAYFPLQHTAQLIAAAKRGERQFSANVYDGSELGQQYFRTTAVIGKAASGDEAELAGIANAERLNGQPSWPVTIAYFNAAAPQGEGTPEHEMIFRVYPNGVIRSVKLDYGTLRLDGQLSAIDFLAAKPCGG